MTAVLQAVGLTKRFEEVQALDAVSFSVGEGELFCIVGPTNAGKSTLLKTIAGLHRPEVGSIRIRGRDMAGVQPKDRRVSLLFQNIALFPTLSGFDNIAFPLRTAGQEQAAVERRVREVAALLKVEHLLDRLPKTFSGGEQQRVAIGRAIAGESDLLMLDEPLTNLDARIRIALRIEFKKLHRELGQSMLYVTHDQVEAMSLSDRIAVMHQGSLQQIGTPDEIYHQPVNRFVARFIGTPPMNILEAELGSEADRPFLQASGFRLPFPQARMFTELQDKGQKLGLGVRPEAMRVAPAEGPETPFAGEVFWVEHLGSKSVLDVRLGESTVKAVVAPDHPVTREGRAWFGFDPQLRLLLDLESEIFLR